MKSFRNSFAVLIIWMVFFFFGLGEIAAQPHDTISNSDLKNELLLLRALREKDSLKMALLTNELQDLVRPNNQLDATEYDSLFIKQKAEVDRLRSKILGYPVVFFADTLFRIYSPIGPYDAQTRAHKLQENLLSLYNKPFFIADSLKVKEAYGFINIQYQNEVITSITLNDAIWMESTPEQLASQQAQQIREVVIKNRNAHSFKNNLIRIAELLLIIVIASTIIFLINRLFGFIQKKLLQSNYIANHVKFKNYELIKKEHIQNILTRVVALVKYLLIFFLLVTIVPIILNLFPSTQIWSELLKSWIWDPIKTIAISFVNYLPKLFKIAIIILIVRFIIRVLKYYSIEIERGVMTIKGFYPEWAKTTYNLLRVMLILFALVIIFPNLPGSDSEAFKGISVFLGILISIGSSSAIANAIAGLVLTYMRPFKPGDWIKTGQVTGIVLEKNALVTRLKTINNEDVSIPNSAILSGATINYTSLGKTDGLVITAKVKVAYDKPYHIIENLLLEAANTTHEVAEKPYPYVFQLALEEFYAIYELNAFTFHPENMYFIKSDLIRNIQKVFKEANIPISTSHLVEIKAGSTADSFKKE